MRIRVLKFGGSSFLEMEDYRRIAVHLKERLARDAEKIVIVASAMAGLTERLRGLAQTLTPTPSPEASDALLPLADTLGAGLLRVAAEAAGLRASSLNGFQLGVRTDDNFTRARIQQVDALPLRRALEQADVVVVPGGQAVDGQGRPTMLGKNSSDLTAVVVAAALGLRECEIYSDVCGVYTADPNLIRGTRLIERISYDGLIELSRSGAKVMHYGAVAEGKRHGVLIVCRLNREDYRVGTVIGDGAEPRAVVVDARSIVLELTTPTERVRADALLRAAEVPLVRLDGEFSRRLVVTCGFFDPVHFLSRHGIAAVAQEQHLVSSFEPGQPPQRDIVGKASATLLGQSLHDRMFPHPAEQPHIPAQPPSASGLPERLLPLAPGGRS
ncbi:amino acid kinase family protein [Hyalangium versicolor]|uniref:amino acid kinase family protein n=1 Tax=Hyalangium versicolor TaxID=2861190 RepID=UPI001CC9C7D2|nr:aspartate kinase [Hyalangium versicolor]